MKFSLRDGMLLLVVVALAIWVASAQLQHQAAVRHFNDYAAEQLAIGEQVEQLERLTASIPARLVKQQQVARYAKSVQEYVADFQKKHLPVAEDGETDVRIWKVETVDLSGENQSTTWRRVYVPDKAEVYLKSGVFPNSVSRDWDSAASLGPEYYFTADHFYSDTDKHHVRLPTGHSDIKISITSDKDSHRRYSLELNDKILLTLDYDAPAPFTGSSSSSMHPDAVLAPLKQNVHLLSQSNTFTNDSSVDSGSNFTLWLSGDPTSSSVFPNLSQEEHE